MEKIKQTESIEENSLAMDILKSYKKLTVFLAALLVGLVVSLIGVFVYSQEKSAQQQQSYIDHLSQYDYSSSSVMVDGGINGNAGYVGGDGDVNNGENNSKEN